MILSNSLPLLSYLIPRYTSLPLNAFHVITVVQGSVAAGLVLATASHNGNRIGITVGLHLISI
jgi:hypothetical protein